MTKTSTSHPRDPRSQATALTTSLSVIRERAMAAIKTRQEQNPADRIALIRNGIPATRVEELASIMGMSKAKFIRSLQFSRASFNRKVRDGTMLSTSDTERVFGIERLIYVTQTMVEQSGMPENFHAPSWVATWIDSPLPALGGATPASYFDTFEGQQLVIGLLSISQSGAYA